MVFRWLTYIVHIVYIVTTALSLCYLLFFRVKRFLCFLHEIPVDQHDASARSREIFLSFFQLYPYSINILILSLTARSRCPKKSILMLHYGFFSKRENINYIKKVSLLSSLTTHEIQFEIHQSKMEWLMILELS